MTTSADRSRDAVLAAYDRQVDGLFTYCLSVLCEHEAAIAAVREVRALARQHGARLAEPGLVRAWLYSLARYCCLRRLAEGPAAPAATEPAPAEAVRRRRELAALAWPEAAGTGPEQREALELAVRHRLSPIEVAAVLGIPFADARAVLAAAEAEVGRTRSALLVLGVGSCPELDRLGGAGAESWRDWVLGPTLRRELVQHVVECPTCRGTAERVAGEVGEGLAALPGLPMLAAPAGALSWSAAEVPSARVAEGAAPAVAYLPGAQAGRRSGAPVPVTEPGLRFDQRGFPRHRAPDSGRGTVVRQRVVTTGVLAAVLAAPVVALWAGHRDGGGPGAAATVSSVRVGDDARPGDGGPRPQEPAPGPLLPVPGHPSGPAPAGSGLMLAGAGLLTAETLFPGIQGPAVPVPGHGATPLGSPTLVAAPAPAALPFPGGSDPGGQPERPAPTGLLTVQAGEYSGRTVLTLTNSGTTDIHWHAEVDVAWLRLSRDSGTLLPGQRITVIVTVDEQLAPNAPWTARIALPPSHAVVTLEGGPQHRGGATSAPAEPSASATPEPSASPSSQPTASPSDTPTAGPSASSSPSPSSSSPPSSSPAPSSSSSASATPSGPSASPTGPATGTP